MESVKERTPSSGQLERGSKTVNTADHSGAAGKVKARFGKIPDWVFESGAFARMLPDDAKVYTAICRFANGSTFSARPSMDTVARAAGVAKRTVVRAVARLKAAGVIVVERPDGGRGGRHRCNVYHITTNGDTGDTVSGDELRPTNGDTGDTVSGGVAGEPRNGDTGDTVSDGETVSREPETVTPERETVTAEARNGDSAGTGTESYDRTENRTEQQNRGGTAAAVVSDSGLVAGDDRREVERELERLAISEPTRGRLVHDHRVTMAVIRRAKRNTRGAKTGVLVREIQSLAVRHLEIAAEQEKEEREAQERHERSLAALEKYGILKRSAAVP